MSDPTPSALSAEELDALEKVARGNMPESWSDATGWKDPLAVSKFGIAFDPPTVLRLIAAARNQARTPVSDGGAVDVVAAILDPWAFRADDSSDLLARKLGRKENQQIAARKMAADILAALADRTPVEDGGAAARVAELQNTLLYIATTDRHYRTPPKPRPDGGIRGRCGMVAIRALTGQHGSYVTDDEVRAALATSREGERS